MSSRNADRIDAAGLLTQQAADILTSYVTGTDGEHAVPDPGEISRAIRLLVEALAATIALAVSAYADTLADTADDLRKRIISLEGAAAKRPNIGDVQASLNKHLAQDKDIRQRIAALETAASKHDVDDAQRAAALEAAEDEPADQGEPT